MENMRNQNGIGEKELLVVSFGTTFAETRKKTIGAVEEAMENAFPDYTVRRAFTSRIILKRLLERDGIAIDSPEQALERAANNNVKELIIQPTHLMDGNEYHKLCGIAENYAASFEKIAIGAPLLTSEEDFNAILEAVIKHFPTAETENAVLLMGHGTDAASNAVYSKLQEKLREAGKVNYYIATVEGEPVIGDILPELIEKRYQKVTLAPLMIVAGDHANNDLAGDEEDSWKSILEKEGFATEAVLSGIGEWEEVQQLFVEHAREQID